MLRERQVGVVRCSRAQDSAPHYWRVLDHLQASKRNNTRLATRILSSDIWDARESARERALVFERDEGNKRVALLLFVLLVLLLPPSLSSPTFARGAALSRWLPPSSPVPVPSACGTASWP